LIKIIREILKALECALQQLASNMTLTTYLDLDSDGESATICLLCHGVMHIDCLTNTGDECARCIMIQKLLREKAPVEQPKNL